MENNSQTMRVFNLTDVVTPALKKSGNANMTFVVGRLALHPGESGTTVDDPLTRKHLSYFVQLGAAAMNVLPPEYVIAKDRQAKQAAVK